MHAWLDAAERAIRLNELPAVEEFQRESSVLRHIVERPPGGRHLPPAEHPKDVIDVAERAIINQLDMLRQLAANRQSPEWTWLPDTIALYDRHELHLWPASRPTVLQLAPTVIKEVDLHKQDGRYPQRRQKARALVAQIKEIRRRTGHVVRGNLRLVERRQRPATGSGLLCAHVPETSRGSPALDDGQHGSLQVKREHLALIPYQAGNGARSHARATSATSAARLGDRAGRR